MVVVSQEATNLLMQVCLFEELGLSEGVICDQVVVESDRS